MELSLEPVNFERTARANLANGPRPASGRLASRAASICSCVLTSGSDVFECSLALVTCRLCRLASLLSIDQQYNTCRHRKDVCRPVLSRSASTCMPLPWLDLGAALVMGGFVARHTLRRSEHVYMIGSYRIAHERRFRKGKGGLVRVRSCRTIWDQPAPSRRPYTQCDGCSAAIDL